MSAKPRAAAAKRGCRTERQWQDIRRLAWLARDEGVALTMHGITVTPPSLSDKDKCPLVEGRNLTAVRDGREQQSLETSDPARDAAADTAAAAPSSRQRRNAQRLLEYQQKVRALRAAETTDRAHAPRVLTCGKCTAQPSTCVLCDVDLPSECGTTTCASCTRMNAHSGLCVLCDADLNMA